MADKQEVARLSDLAYDMRAKLVNLCGQHEGAVHIGGNVTARDGKDVADYIRALKG